ncbi:MAG: hypothetical protein HQ593_02925 [Candidatus Omnitrophica bacterium]|nr:hypothetical protein [Candidatus Omnitrophota bacterium]
MQGYFRTQSWLYTRSLTGFFICVLFFATSGCGRPTFSKERLAESLVELCERDYGLKGVKAKLHGNVLGAYYSADRLLNDNFWLSEESSEKSFRLITAISRVSVSTDAEVDFYCVVYQDTRFPEVELVLLGEVDDVKRADMWALSPDELNARRLVDLKASPEIKRGEMLKALFTKMGLETTLADQFMGGYLSGGIAESIDDIGYWNGRFFLKEIEFEEFLASQVANRLRLMISQDTRFVELATVQVDGEFDPNPPNSGFTLDVNLFTGDAEVIDASISEEKLRELFESSFILIADILDGYHFWDFDRARIYVKNTGTERSADSAGLKELYEKKREASDIIRGK